MSIIFSNFKSAGDNLSQLIELESDYSMNLYIENFFNNLFIWGLYIHKNEFDCVYNTTENIQTLLNNAINEIDIFLHSKEIKAYTKINIIKDIETFYNYLAKIKDNLKYLGIRLKNNFVYFLDDEKKYENELIKLGRGHLVQLSCGHNGLPSSDEYLTFLYYFNRSPFFEDEELEFNHNKKYKHKKKKENIIYNDDSFTEENNETNISTNNISINVEK